MLCQEQFCSFAVLVHAFLPVSLVFIDFYLKVENVFVDIRKISPAFRKRRATQHDEIAIRDAFVNADNSKMLHGIFTVQGRGEGAPRVFGGQFTSSKVRHLV